MARPSNTGGRTLRCAVAEGGNKVTRGVAGQNHQRKQRFGIVIRGGGWLRPTLAMLLAMSYAVGGTVALDIAYCSNFNTGSSSAPMVNTFQSNGLCQGYCVADYAFAVLQGTRCWCSNYMPSTEATECTQGCPGFITEFCGNTMKGLFGYIALSNNAPSGTLGPTSTVRTTSTPPASSTSSSPIDTTSIPAPPSISTVVEVKTGPTKTLIITTTQSPTSTSSTTTTTPTSATSTTPPPPPPTTPAYTSVNTVIPTAETTGPSLATSEANSGGVGFFSKPGNVAGLVIGIILFIITIIAGLLFFCYRRNRRRAMRDCTEAGGAIPAGGAGIMAGRRRSRSLSTLGLIGEKGFHSVNTTPATGPPNMAGLNGVGTKLVDQRLDPSQLYLRYDPDTGSSRMSVRSLRDDADYSRRVLRLANPDD